MLFLSRVSIPIMLWVSLFHVGETSLENKSIYHIRNSLDKTYLLVREGGVPCKSIGSVGTTSALNNMSSAYRWIFSNVSIPSIEYAMLDVQSDGQLLEINEVSMTTDNGPSPCYNVFREYKFIPVSENTFRVKYYRSDEDKNCLTGNGDGKRISFMDCISNRKNQEWEFIKA